MKQAYFFGCCPNVNFLYHLRMLAAHEEKMSKRKSLLCSLCKCYRDAQNPMHINWKTEVFALHQKLEVAC